MQTILDDLETLNGFRDEWDFLSNMYPTNCLYKNLVFKSSEHLYQWLKIPDTPAAAIWKDKIFNATHGKIAKTIAANKSCPSKCPKTGQQWEDFRLECMQIALRSKFSDPILRKRLVESSQYTLVEHNNWNDVFWGCCRGMGRNMLGALLMTLRHEFLAQNLASANSFEKPRI